MQSGDNVVPEKRTTLYAVSIFSVKHVAHSKEKKKVGVKHILFWIREIMTKECKTFCVYSCCFRVALLFAIMHLWEPKRFDLP